MAVPMVDGACVDMPPLSWTTRGLCWKSFAVVSALSNTSNPSTTPRSSSCSAELWKSYSGRQRGIKMSCLVTYLVAILNVVLQLSLPVQTTQGWTESKILLRRRHAEGSGRPPYPQQVYDEDSECTDDVQAGLASRHSCGWKHL